MIFKRFIFLVFTLTLCAFTNKDSGTYTTEVHVTANSSVFVNGTTNVSDFSCAFNVNKFKNPIQVSYHMAGDKMVFDKTALILDSNCFDCGGKAINSDFKKILKADKYPQIKLFLKEITQLDKSPNLHALVRIEIASITKGYTIPVKIKNSDNLVISGNLNISLKAYNLEAPKKLFGLIEVDDKIDIVFELGIKEK